MDKRLLRILVVDDTVLYRKVLSETLAQIPGVEVVGSAIDGKVALAKIKALKPDMLTLDFEMPVMDGLEVLEHVRRDHPELKVVMVSSHTKEGAAITLKALELGALTFITKPAAANPLESRDILLGQLTPVVKEIIGQLQRTKDLSHNAQSSDRSDASYDLVKKSPPAAGHIHIVAIGISTGGPNALAEVLPLLPSHFRVPIVIVQHMPSQFTSVLAESLDKKCALQVVEAQHDMELKSGTVFLAPGGKQMKIVKAAGKFQVEVNDDPPENHCQPSVDYLFRSISQIYENHALGVIMTGMGSDGSLGARLMKRRGARIIAQDEQSCVVFGMPSEVINAGVVDFILPLNQIADEIRKLVGA